MLFPPFVRIRTLDSRVRGNDIFAFPGNRPRSLDSRVRGNDTKRHPSRWTRPGSVHYNACMLRHCARLAPAKAGVMWCLGVGCLALALVMLHAFVPQRARDVARAQTDAPARDGLDALATEPGESSGLNVRLSQRAIHPPKSLVKEVVDLPHVQAARARIAPSPKSAILEDDHHTRVLVLSMLEDGRLQAQVLADLDFAQHVPFVTACAEYRGCAYDRRSITGGLGCVAICIQQALDPSREP